VLECLPRPDSFYPSSPHEEPYDQPGDHAYEPYHESDVDIPAQGIRADEPQEPQYDEDEADDQK
jgi:hypothetical protein